MSLSRKAGLQWLNVYKKVRMCQPPESRCGLGGNIAMGSDVDGWDSPEANVGLVLPGLKAFHEIENVVWVSIMKGRIIKRTRCGSAGVCGDSAFQFVTYPAFMHAQEGLNRL